MNTGIKIILILLIALLLVFSCAAGPNDLKGQSRGEKSPAGFFLGLWHGFITPFTFIISLFNKNVGIYEAYNNGGWYNFGFVFGLSMIFGGSGGAGKHYHSKRKRDD